MIPAAILALCGFMAAAVWYIDSNAITRAEAERLSVAAAVQRDSAETQRSLHADAVDELEGWKNDAADTRRAVDAQLAAAFDAMDADRRDALDRAAALEQSLEAAHGDAAATIRALELALEAEKANMFCKPGCTIKWDE